MKGLRPVWVHPSLRSETLRLRRKACLDEGRMDPAFHYQSARQADLWLEVHRCHAPLFADPEFRLIFERMAQRMAHEMAGKRVHVIGLGAGGGSKETLVLAALHAAGCAIRYTPVDTSLELALSSAEVAAPFVNDGLFPVAADLQLLADPDVQLAEGDNASFRIYTAFGLAPNVLPSRLFHLLSHILRPQDLLLFSANLAPFSEGEAHLHSPLPAPDRAYYTACEPILAQYDNPETHTWLRQALLDWGLAPLLGPLRFTLQPIESVLAVCASCPWLQNTSIALEGHHFNARAGVPFHVFFSLRYTQARLRSAMAAHRLELDEGFLTPCGQEGVWRVNLSRS